MTKPHYKPRHKLPKTPPPHMAGNGYAVCFDLEGERHYYRWTDFHTLGYGQRRDVYAPIGKSARRIRTYKNRSAARAAVTRLQRYTKHHLFTVPLEDTADVR